ncbi:MAG: YhfC family glutamic-type intramembrane protease, partial [Candidatus Promineifilaceae bacterium]
MIYLLFTISIFIMITLPIIAAVFWRRRFRVPWLYFCVGILTFLGAQAVHIPFNNLLGKLGWLPQLPAEGGQLVQAAIILGLTAGLGEELARAIGYLIVKKARRFEDAVLFGLGHGGIEAMIFGGVSLAASAGLFWFVQHGGTIPGATADQLSALNEQFNLIIQSPLLSLVAVVERLIAMTLHIVLSVMVLQAFSRRKWFYLVAAILYHAVVDASAVYVAQQIENTWLVEGLLALLVVPGLIWLWRTGKQADLRPSEHLASLKEQWPLFTASLSKELKQQWRTRRFIIVGAVFIVFGMISPLLARFLPQILGSVQGAEQFADLIPEPTIADALGQYIKNLTQFGFILAIVLGMGAVAGEKEKGTAAMILSKPMPRWAFITGKFAAQTIVYLVSFLIAAVSAYYYTYFLFGPPAAGPFLLMNALLLIWLMVFVAVTLLGSTLGKSTGGAAGIAAVGSILLLVLGSVPAVSQLMPGALVGWAGQLTLPDMPVPSGGA